MPNPQYFTNPVAEMFQTSRKVPGLRTVGPNSDVKVYRATLDTDGNIVPGQLLRTEKEDAGKSKKGGAKK